MMDKPLSPTLLPSAPDGGWGWVIVATSFLYQALVDGSFSVIAVFMPHFLEHFQAGAGRTAMVGSVFMGTMLVSGPVVSFVTNLLGCRVVAMLGGLLLSLGYFLATLAPTVEILVLTLGFIGGFGLGMLYLPSVVMCGSYFERKRALAMGITASGAGIGMLLFAPLSNALLNLYDWKNALRVLTCVTLQSVVGGALLRPLTGKPQTSTSSSEEDTESITDDDNQGGVRGGEEHFKGDELNSLASPTTPSPDKLRKIAFLNATKSHHTKPGALSNPTTLLQSRESLTPPHSEVTSSQLPRKHCSEKSSLQDIASSPSCLTENQLKEYSAQDNLLSRTYDNLYTVKLPQENLERICYSYNDVNKAHKSSRQWWRGTAKTETEKGGHNVSATRQDHFMFKPLLRKDVFYSGSIARLPEYRSQPQVYRQTNMIVDDEVKKLEEILSSDQTSCLCIKNKQLFILRKMLDVNLVTDGYFIVICLSNMFMQMGYFIPIMFIAEYAEHIDISTGMAASLISIFGLSNTVGRVCGGAVANLSCVNSVHVAALSMVLSGACTTLCVFCTRYATLATCVGALGFFVAPIIPLANIFLVDYLGLDRLTNAVGLMSLAKGVASLFGAPLAGYLLDQTQSFSACFYLAGSLFTVSGLLHYFLPLITKYRHRTS